MAFPLVNYKRFFGLSLHHINSKRTNHVPVVVHGISFCRRYLALKIDLVLILTSMVETKNKNTFNLVKSHTATEIT